MQTVFIKHVDTEVLRLFELRASLFTSDKIVLSLTIRYRSLYRLGPGLAVSLRHASCSAMSRSIQKSYRLSAPSFGAATGSDSCQTNPGIDQFCNHIAIVRFGKERANSAALPRAQHPLLTADPRRSPRQWRPVCRNDRPKMQPSLRQPHEYLVQTESVPVWCFCCFQSMRRDWRRTSRPCVPCWQVRLVATNTGPRES